MSPSSARSVASAPSAISAAEPAAKTMAPLGAGTVPRASRRAAASVAVSAPSAEKLAARGTGKGRWLRGLVGGTDGGAMTGRGRTCAPAP
jgi:hypothetical protein